MSVANNPDILPDPASVERFIHFFNCQDEEKCWEWTGARNNRGYGAFRFAGRPVYAHRFSWTIFVGRWPERVLLHTCDNPPCVNPNHLRHGSQVDNMQDARAKGRLVRRRPGAQGALHGQAKLNEDLVKKIRQEHLAGESYLALSRRYSVSPSTVNELCRGETWQHVPLPVYSPLPTRRKICAICKLKDARHRARTCSKACENMYRIVESNFRHGNSAGVDAE